MSPVQGAPWGGAGPRKRRELLPASIRHAAVTGLLVLGAPMFITGLAIAGVSIPDTLRSPLIQAGLLTRDANEAMEADAEQAPAATVAPTGEAAGARAATRVVRDEPAVAGSNAGPERDAASEDSDASGSALAPTETGEPASGSVPAQPHAPPEEPAPAQPAETGGPGSGEEGVAGPAAPSPVQDGFNEVDETVDQVDDAFGNLPLDHSSSGLPSLEGGD